MMMITPTKNLVWKPSFLKVNFLFEHLITYKIEKPQEEVFEEGVKDMNQFLEAINKFEKITNATLSDLWKIKDTGF